MSNADVGADVTRTTRRVFTADYKARMVASLSGSGMVGCATFGMDRIRVAGQQTTGCRQHSDEGLFAQASIKSGNASSNRWLAGPEVVDQSVQRQPSRAPVFLRVRPPQDLPTSLTVFLIGCTRVTMRDVRLRDAAL